MFTKFRGVAPADLDGVIRDLTDDEFDHLEQVYVDHVSQLIYDEMYIPLGLAEGVDSSALYCRLYRMSLQKSGEARQ